MIILQHKNGSFEVCNNITRAKNMAIENDVLIINKHAYAYPNYIKMSELTSYTQARKSKDNNYYNKLDNLKSLVRSALIWESLN